jgi:hypothetical protein
MVSTYDKLQRLDELFITASIENNIKHWNIYLDKRDEFERNATSPTRLPYNDAPNIFKVTHNEAMYGDTAGVSLSLIRRWIKSLYRLDWDRDELVQRYIELTEILNGDQND